MNQREVRCIGVGVADAGELDGWLRHTARRSRDAINLGQMEVKAAGLSGRLEIRRSEELHSLVSNR